MAKENLVPRPAKKSDFEIQFATTGAPKGWIDLVATIRNAVADTWDFLTATPMNRTPTNYDHRIRPGGRGSAGSVAGLA